MTSTSSTARPVRAVSASATSRDWAMASALRRVPSRRAARSCPGHGRHRRSSTSARVTASTASGSRSNSRAARRRRTGRRAPRRAASPARSARAAACRRPGARSARSRRACAVVEVRAAGRRAGPARPHDLVGHAAQGDDGRRDAGGALPAEERRDLVGDDLAGRLDVGGVLAGRPAPPPASRGRRR